MALAQLDLVVGDVAGNTAANLDYAAARAPDEMRRADLVVFPELSVCGYPPEDLLFHAGLQRARRERDGRDSRKSATSPCWSVSPSTPTNIYNAAAVFRDGEVLRHYRKQLLPNYSVFDEERYFTAGTTRPASFD